ncbi:MAG: PHP domain-containing protein, partial [Actinomycetia bacterium]|nr:PHP domain-containing protein [Actinomycetes bacterium]
MDPVEALREIVFWMERSRAETRRVQAYRKAADVVEGLSDEQREQHARARSWTSLGGIGPSTAKAITQAVAGQEPTKLTDLKAAATPIGGGDTLRQALRGDLHMHSNWSDGGSPIEEMAVTALELGHDYLALTDHSPRLTVANGLSPERLEKQLRIVTALKRGLGEFTLLSGIECDINEDGTLDQSDDLLGRVDVVVASVHSKLRSPAAVMTERMLAAIENPYTDVLGHCTGRLVTGG